MGRTLPARLLRLFPLIVLILGVGLRALDLPVVQELRNTAFDQFQRIEPRDYQPLPVKVIDIDEDSLAAFGQWPWPRNVMAELVNRLQRLGAAAIGFDLIMAESDRLSPDSLIDQLGEIPELKSAVEEALESGNLPQNDALLGRVIAQGRVVTGMVLTDEGAPAVVKAGFAEAGDDPRLFLPRFSGAINSLPVFTEAAAGNGALNVLRGSGGTIRRLPLLFNVDGALAPALSMEMLRVAQGASTYVVRSSGASGVTAFGEQTGVNAVKVGALEIPSDGTGQVWLYDTGPRRDRLISAMSILAPGESGPPDLNGFLVLIGSSAAGLRDQHSTPLGLSVPGVTLHIQILEQMLTETYLSRPDWAPGAEVVFILALSLLILYAYWRRKLAPLALAAAGTLGVVLAVGGAWMLFSHARFLIDPITPTIVCVAVYLSASLIQFLETDQEKRQVREAFSHYLEPQLVDILSEDPSKLKLGGERKELTLLFCDLRGFTTLSEKLPVDETTEVINRFLTAMSEAILANHGTIDKYMGDCVMAFWNAPLDDPDHARNACLAALDMRHAMTSVQRDYPELRMGIGLNSGLCSVGNMGSADRFDYSAIGDNVNLASRLEGETKTYRLDIIVSESTRQAAGDLPFLEVGDVIVRGRHEAVTIYTLPTGVTASNAGDFADLVARHDELVAAIKAKDAGAAKAILGDLAKRRGYPEGLAWYLELVLDTPGDAGRTPEGAVEV